MKTGPTISTATASITQMRVRDPNGRYKPHPDFPELMVQAKPDEKGEYHAARAPRGSTTTATATSTKTATATTIPTAIGAGTGSRDYVQNGAIAIRFRSWKTAWSADFITAHPQHRRRPVVSQRRRHDSPRARRPRTTASTAADVPCTTRSARQGEQMLPGYRYMNIGNDLYEVYGGEVDWLYHDRGALCLHERAVHAVQLLPQDRARRFLRQPTKLQQPFNKYLLLGEGLRRLGTRSTIRSTARSKSAA